MNLWDSCPNCSRPVMDPRKVSETVYAQACQCSRMPATSQNARSHAPKAQAAVIARPAPTEAKYGASVSRPSQTFTLPWPPQSNNFKIPVLRGKKVFMILSKEARQYKADAAKRLLAQKPFIMRGPLEITFRLYRPRRVGDWDGAVKIPQDCLNGVAFEDDEQIIDAHVYRRDDKHNPRVEIMLQRAVVAEYAVTEELEI